MIKLTYVKIDRMIVFLGCSFRFPGDKVALPLIVLSEVVLVCSHNYFKDFDLTSKSDLILINKIYLVTRDQSRCKPEKCHRK